MKDERAVDYALRIPLLMSAEEKTAPICNQNFLYVHNVFDLVQHFPKYSLKCSP